MSVDGFDINKVLLGNQVYLNSSKEENYDRVIDVLLCTDENYVSHMAVTMASVLVNLSPSTYVRFHIMSANINELIKKKLSKLKELRSFDIFYYDISNYKMDNFPLNREHITVASYYRLLVCDILPENISKILYLDCDMVVEEDLTKLWDIDIGNNYVAVAEDEASGIHMTKGKIKYQDFYFNSGVILFDLNLLRSFHLFAKCVDYFEKNEKSIVAQDQDILNGVLDGKCYKLPLRWNVATPYYLFDNWQLTCPAEDRWEAIYNPAILHYTYVPKPWQKECVHPLKKEYFKYLALTPFAAKNSSFLGSIEFFYK